MYKSKHFKIEHLVPESVLKLYGEKRALEYLKSESLMMIDRLVNAYGKAIINDYSDGGTESWRGLRTPDYKKYTWTSQHSSGNGFDLIFVNTPTKEIRDNIILYPDKFEHELINAVELDVSWLHVDRRNCDRIKTFSK